MHLFSRGAGGILVASLCFVLMAVRPFGSSAPAGWTGAPGDPGDCSSSCHSDFPVNSGQGSVQINSPETYLPGTMYDFEVTVSDPVALRFGFEIVAKDAAAVSAGEWTIVDGARTKLVGFPPVYVTHNDAPVGTISESFQVRWTAPSADIGDITFYAAGNGANNNGSRTGDLIYTTSRVIRPAGATATESEIPFRAFQVTDVFPIPFVDHTTFYFRLGEPASVSVELYDLAGRQIRTESFGTFSSGSHSARFTANNLPVGILIYRLTAGRESATGRLISVR